jgi:hypothetical protein
MVPGPSYVIRTDDDAAAAALLGRLGCRVETSRRGVHLPDAFPLAACLEALAGGFRVLDVTPERSLFNRVYDRFGASTPTRRRNR